MPMTPKARKAAFRYAATMKGSTLHAAAATMGVTLYHLQEGLRNPKRRKLSGEVQKKFAAYIGQPVESVFPADVLRVA